MCIRNKRPPFAVIKNVAFEALCKNDSNLDLRIAMKRFRSVLVVINPGLDNSLAIKRATDLAKANDANVELLAVVEPLTGALRNLLPNSGNDLEEGAKADALDQLDELAAAFREQDITVTTVVRMGPPAIEVIREVLRNNYGVVIKMAEHDRGGVIGGSDMRLLRKCPCPVWLVPDHAEPGLRCVLAAVDTSFSDAAEEELSRDILRLATSLAEREDAELHIVHAWTQPGASYMAKRMTMDEFDRFVADARERNSQRFDDLLHEFGMKVADANVHLDPGEPEEVIPACASKYDADLIVMGTIARAGLSGLLMGNTAERVLHNVRRGVLAVKPKDFISPVTLD